MATQRYFKFTDGTDTYFRASKTKVYLSGVYARHAISFSGKPASLRTHPCTEIAKAEYDRLVELKTARLAQRGHTHWLIGPQDSWVENSRIEEDAS